MIYISENSIVSAFTSGVSVKKIFTNGVQVWPEETPPVPTSYYIKWLPSSLSGSFIIGGSTYNFEDYSGYFSNFDGTIPASAFEKTGVTRIETNAINFGSRAFAECTSLLAVYLSNCSEIVNEEVFRGCTSLKTVSLPICTSIGKATFRDCTALSSINLPKVQYISLYGFRDCPELSIVNLPKCSVIGGNAFYISGNINDRKALSISCPVCERYQDACFQGRNLIGVSKMDFTSCKYIGIRAFYNAIGLYESSIKPVYDFPNCSYIGSFAFYNCGFSFMKLSNVTYISDYAFNYDADHWGWPETSYSVGYRYISIYTSTVCSLFSSGVFEKFLSGSFVQGAEIYVPSSLYSEYLSAQYWSDISTHIHKIAS